MLDDNNGDETSDDDIKFLQEDYSDEKKQPDDNEFFPHVADSKENSNLKGRFDLSEKRKNKIISLK